MDDKIESVSHISRNGGLTIPAALRKKLHLKQGDLVAFRVKGDYLIIAPVHVVDRDQAYFFSSACQQEIKESEENIKKGKFKKYSSAKALEKDLEL